MNGHKTGDCGCGSWHGDFQVSPAVYRLVRHQIETARLLDGCCDERMEAAAGKAVEMLERLETDPVGMDFGVNVKRIWQIMAKSLYRDSDYLGLAVREAMQNSLDAILAAYRTRGPYHTPSGEGVFNVQWEDHGNGLGTLTLSDNGIGMDRRVLIEKFLSLASTGKGGEAQEGVSDVDLRDSFGGFGVAKAVIFAAASQGRWTIRTRDQLVTSGALAGVSQSFTVAGGQPEIKGTTITLYDVESDDRFSEILRYSGDADARIRGILTLSDCPAIRVLYNRARVANRFERNRGSAWSEARNFYWGENNSVRVRKYRRPPGDTHGAFYYRLDSRDQRLYQFTYAPYGGFGFDVVVDIATTNRPDDPAYPLLASRDGLNSASPFNYADRNMRETLIQEWKVDASVGEDYEYTAEDAHDLGADEGVEEVRADVAKALEDMDDALRAAIQASANIVLHEDENAQQARKANAHRYGGYEGVEAEGAKAEKFMNAWDVVAEAAKERHRGEEAPQEVREAAGSVVQSLLKGAEGAGEYVNYRVMGAAEAMGRGEVIGAGEARNLVEALMGLVDKGVEVQVAGGRPASQAALMGMVKKAAEAVIEASDAKQDERLARDLREQVRKANPFGSLGVLVKHKKYGAQRYRWIKQRAAYWAPYMALWDTAVRLIAKHGGIRLSFQTGFICDPEVRGMARKDPRTGKLQVLVNPDLMEAQVKAAKSDPYVLANYVHHIAVHEVSHLGYMGKHHDDSFVTARENLGTATVGVVPVLAEMAAKLFHLKNVTLGPLGDRVLREKVAEKDEALKAAVAEMKKYQRAADRAQRAQQAVEAELKQMKKDRQIGVPAKPLIPRDQLPALVSALAKLADLHRFRAWVEGPGKAYLPSKVPADAFLAALDEAGPAVLDQMP